MKNANTNFARRMRMTQVSEVMIQHPEFCNLETRVPDLLYIFKKYNYDEIVIVDSESHPLGIVKMADVSDDALKTALHSFDVKAREVMMKTAAPVVKSESLEQCLKLMENNHVSLLPVVDEKGHCLGVVKKEDLTAKYHAEL